MPEWGCRAGGAGRITFLTENKPEKLQKQAGYGKLIARLHVRHGGKQSVDHMAEGRQLHADDRMDDNVLVFNFF